MSAETTDHIHEQPEEPEESEAFRHIREALAEGASWVISYAKEDLERYGRYGDKPYAYYRVGKTVLKAVE